MKIGGIPDISQRECGHALVGKEVAMTKEKPNRFLERNAHKFTIGGQALTLLSILFLVPFLRRRHEQRKVRGHSRFAILGH